MADLRSELEVEFESSVKEEIIKSKHGKDRDSELSLSSNEDFEVIGRQLPRKSEEVIVGEDGDEKAPSSLSRQLFASVTKRRRVLPEKQMGVKDVGTSTKKSLLDKSTNLRDKSRKRTDSNNEVGSEEEHRDEFSSLLRKMLIGLAGIFVAFEISRFAAVTVSRSKMHNFSRSEGFSGENPEDTIVRQRRMIEKLEKELKGCKRLDPYSLPVRVDEDRATAFSKKNGFDYYFVIVDWKKDDQGIAQQHLHLAFKQSNSSIYVYDHGPSSGKHFAVGDRIVDVDGKAYSKAIEIRDQILWSRHNKDYFTSIIERPSTEQATRAVSLLLQPAQSSFSVVLST